VMAEVARTYMEFRGVQERLKITERNCGAQRELLNLTRVRAKAGLATELDVERQTSLLASTESAIPALENAKARHLHRLDILLGEAPDP